MLFLAYALFYCFFITITAFQHSLNFFKVSLILSSTSQFAILWFSIFSVQNEPVLEKKNIHILLVFCSALVFTISLTSLFSYHCYLVIKNRSTLGQQLNKTQQIINLSHTFSLSQLQKLLDHRYFALEKTKTDSVLENTIIFKKYLELTHGIGSSQFLLGKLFLFMEIIRLIRNMCTNERYKRLNKSYAPNNMKKSRLYILYFQNGWVM